MNSGVFGGGGRGTSVARMDSCMNKIAFLGAALALGVVALVACSSEATNPGAAEGSSGGAETDAADFKRDGSVYDSAPSPESGLGELLFRPDRVFTGRDGTHTFQVPVAVYDADSDLTVTADDPAGVTITKATLTNPVNQDGVTDNGRYFLLTALKAGTFTLTATSKGKSATASLTVTSYDAGRYAAGEARYTNGIVTKTADRACTTCHVQGMGIDHSPAALGTATEQDVGVIITTGVKPGIGGPQVIKIKDEPGTQHKWDVTDAEKDGLITYLRGLPPRGFQ
jgi:hypothetical protein